MSFQVTAGNPTTGFAIDVSTGAVTYATVKVWDGGAWLTKPLKVWNGSAWVVKPVKAWDSAAWS